MSEARTMARTVFRVFATALLAAFGVFILTVTFCAASLDVIRQASGPKGERERLVREGYQLVSITFGSPKFSDDDAFVVFERFENYQRPVEFDNPISPVRPVETRNIPEVKHVPTGRVTSRANARIDLSLCEEYIRRLFALYGIAEDPSFPLTLSHDHLELAFLQTRGRGGGPIRRTDGIVRRTAGGQYQALALSDLPPDLERINSFDRSHMTLEDRLAHPDPFIWLDAAVESFLQNGVQARILTDRIIRTYRLQAPQLSGLITLLLSLRGADALDEACRGIVEMNEDGLRQVEMLRALCGTPGDAEGEVRVLAALGRQEWNGRNISLYLRGWLVHALELRSFDDLEPADRDRVWDRMWGFVEPSACSRLGYVLTTADGPSGAAAYLLLRKFAGVPLAQVSLTTVSVAEGRRWWAKNGPRLLRENNGH